MLFASIAVCKVNVLLLDEPTNHLDVESVDALVSAIDAFPGAVVLVSHDHYVLSSTQCKVYVCEGDLILANSYSNITYL